MIRGVGAIKSPSGVQFPRGTSPGECMGGEAFRQLRALAVFFYLTANVALNFTQWAITV